VVVGLDDIEVVLDDESGPKLQKADSEGDSKIKQGKTGN